MIIGISGKMGTGKTTLADMLAERLGGKRISFANALRKEVAETFRIPESLLGDREYKERGQVMLGNAMVTPRQLMQWWGGIRREGDSDYWVKKALDDIEGPHTIIDDVRYKNEARMLLAIGGLLIRLEPYEGWAPGSGAAHISETDLDGYTPTMITFHPCYGGLGSVADSLLRCKLRPVRD